VWYVSRRLDIKAAVSIEEINSPVAARVVLDCVVTGNHNSSSPSPLFAIPCISTLTSTVPPPPSPLCTPHWWRKLWYALLWNSWGWGTFWIAESIRRSYTLIPRTKHKFKKMRWCMQTPFEGNIFFFPDKGRNHQLKQLHSVQYVRWLSAQSLFFTLHIWPGSLVNKAVHNNI
jgi:hypothetical protein